MAIKNVPPPVGAGTGNGFSAADHRMLPVLRLLDLVDRECAEKNSSDLEQVEVLTRAIRNELDAFLADLPTQQPQAAVNDQARLCYQVLREKNNRAAAVANALGLHQTPDSHAFHLSQQLDDMMGEAEIWILQNQLGRRNLTDYVRVELALLLKPLIAKKSEEVRRESQGRPNKLSQNSDAVIEFSKVRTDETIAAAAGVSRDTVRKVESIRENAPAEVQEAARAGAMSINLASQVAALPDEEKAVVAAAPIESIKDAAIRLGSQ